MSAYYNIALTNFYLGRIEKAEYYVNRVMRGKTEAMFSVIKKISLTNTRRKFKDIKPKPMKSDDYTQKVIKGENITEKFLLKGIQELFSKHLINYSLMDHEILLLLGYDKKLPHDYISMDPTLRYINCSTPLSSMSHRNLPSPYEVKGDAHLLLMPFY